ncbi:hypothetical protein K4039_00970 [Lyngbya sp. CCAP 1446/10]|uniref:hypothetical protein n=1 Tax=unclassified Microcoleus TaxID=2642155 RepID=UPI002FD53869|nr:hypothetical protein [Lyngbya sp. CCAP 1446/10]
MVIVIRTVSTDVAATTRSSPSTGILGYSVKLHPELKAIEQSEIYPNSKNLCNSSFGFPWFKSI